MKRLMDLVLSLLALVLLAPLLQVLAILATMCQPGLVLQTRIGLGGCEFGMYKSNG